MADSNEQNTLSNVIAGLNKLESRLKSVEERLVELERRGGVSGAPQKASSTVTSTPTKPKPVPQAKVVHQPSVLGEALRTFFTTGNPLNKLGAVTLLLGAGLFFKLAVDNEWIGPTARVGLGIIAGLLLLAAGEYVERRKWTNIAAGFIGAGEGVIFIAIYAAQHRYELIGQGPAFTVNVVLTGVIFAQALRYNSQAVAVMGLLGGFLTPILASTGSNNYLALAIYLLILNSAVFAIAIRKEWHTLKWMAFAFTEFYLISWADRVDSTSGRSSGKHFSIALEWILPFLAIFFVYFTGIATYRGLKRQESFSKADIALTIANGVISFGLAYILLRDPHRATLGIVALIVGGMHFFLCSRVLAFEVADRRMYKTMLGMGAWYLFAAVPMMLSGHHITIAWCLEGVAIAWLSKRERYQFLETHVLAILGLVGVRLLLWDRVLRTVRYANDATYFPLGDRTTLTAFIAAVSCYVIVRITADSEMWRKRSAWLVVSAGIVLIAVFFRESHALANLVIAHALPRHAIELMTFSLWAALTAGVLIFALRALLDRPEFAKFVILAAGGLMAFTVIFFWNPIHRSYAVSGVNLGRVAFVEHFSALLLLALVGLGVVVFSTLSKIEGEGSGVDEADPPKTPWLVLLGTLFVLIVVIRRELHALIFLPPIGELIDPRYRTSAYQMSLSCAYSIIAFILYLRGVSREQRGVVYAGYALFAMTGVKVYLYDLANVSQLYRVLTLLVFGVLLLVSDAMKQRIIERREA